MTDISRTQAWLESLRPKTLPLAFAAIIVGTALAWWQGISIPGCPAGMITAGLLQILSNLANDYGDAVKGSDKPDRIGPLRGMQKGVITQAQMKRALIITVVLICLSGLALLFLPGKPWRFHRLYGAGRLSIIAAITYTVGTVLTAISALAISPCWCSSAGLA
jgi:1,4-dihydroxy-2-naphthoate octaprenyltransferase